MRNALAEFLLTEAHNNQNIVLITGDLGFGVLNKFQSELPDQFMNAGIAEQSMMSMAAGLASQGFRPFVYSIANFSTFRCLEQIRNDVSYMDNPVTIISVGAGLGYGSHGYSHHAVEDISIMRSLGNVDVYSPGDPSETVSCLSGILAINRPAYIRVGKGGEAALSQRPASDSLPRIIKSSDDSSAIISTGAIATVALKAHQLLTESGRDTNLVSVPWLDCNVISEFLRLNNFEFILTLEEHVLPGGFGSLLLEVINSLGLSTRVKRMGLRTDLHNQVGSMNHLLNLHGLNPIEVANNFKFSR